MDGQLYIGFLILINKTVFIDIIIMKLLYINRACKRNNFVLVDLLLKNGASKEIKNLDGKSADEYTTDDKVASLFNSNYI
jgi:hypothetical protein